MAWKDLSIAQRSQLMNIMRHNGISSLSEMRRLYDLSSPSLSSLEESTFNMQPQAPVYAGGGGKTENTNEIRPGESIAEWKRRITKKSAPRKSLFDREKIANRVPGDDAMYDGTHGVRSAVHHYLNNDDNYVEDRIRHAIDAADQGLISPSYLNQILVHEDAKRMYLGLPQKYGSFEPSAYKPTIGKSDSPYQLNAMMSDEEFENTILPLWGTWKTGDDWPLYDTASRVQNLGRTAQLRDIPYLQAAGLSEGMDRKGQYLSLYDVWDYNTKVKDTNGDNIGRWIGGKPFDIYQRYYLDDWLDIPEGERGNPYIAPSYVEAVGTFKSGGPKKRETAYARKYREEQEAKAKRALEHPTLSNAFRNDVSSETGDKYYDVINARYHQSMDALRRKGFTYEDALRLAPLIVTQNIVEGGWRVTRPDDNNFGGLRENGRFLKFDSPEEYYDNYLDLLDRKWGASRGTVNNWRTAQNLDDWSRILNREDLNLRSKGLYDAYNREHRDNPVYLYAPEWENSYKPYREHLAGVEPRVNTYLDMVLEENPYTKEMYSAPIEPVAQPNDGFNLSMDQFQKLLKPNKSNGYIAEEGKLFKIGGPKKWIKNAISGKIAKEMSEYSKGFLSVDEAKTILEHPDDYASYLGWDDKKIDELKKNFYNNFSPWGYDLLSGLDALTGGEGQEYPLGTSLSEKMARDYLIANYLGIPEKDRKEPLASWMYEQSPYKPTIGSGDSKEYIRYSTDYNRNKIVDIYNGLMSNMKGVPGWKSEIKPGKEYWTSYLDSPYSVTVGKSGKNLAVSHRGTYDFNIDPYSAALGQYTLGYGTDAERGDYISVYDKWDLNPFNLGSAYNLPKKLIKTFAPLGDASGGFGNPVNFYDRVYLDDYYGVNSRPQNPDEFYGGYIIPATITAERKANGGKIRIKPENRGKFTALKKRTGHSASWFKAHGTPAQKKMAVFALNAKKWKHAHGGIKF